MVAAWVDNLLDEFGARVIGLAGLRLNEQGVAGLSFESGESLFFMYRSSVLSVSLLCPVDAYRRLSVCEHMLSHCHYRSDAEFQVQPGFADNDTMTLSVKIAQQDASCACLDAVVARLRDLSAEIARASR